MTNTETREAAERLRVKTDQTAVEKALADAREGLKHLNRARNIASSIMGKEVSGVTGQMEVNEYLSDPNYPKAPLATISNLKGCANQYKQYLNEVGKAGDIGRYEVKGGEAQISRRYREQIEDEATLYLEGVKREAYLMLDALCKEYNATKEDIGKRIEKFIRVDHNGEASVNLAAFLMGFSGR